MSSLVMIYTSRCRMCGGLVSAMRKLDSETADSLVRSDVDKAFAELKEDFYHHLIRREMPTDNYICKGCVVGG